MGVDPLAKLVKITNTKRTNMINITSRHIKITEEIKGHITSKLDSLDKYSERIKRIDVIIDHVRNLYSLEVIVSVLRGKKIITKVSHYNYLAAVDIVLDKLERQLVKFKEIRKERRSKAASPKRLISETNWSGLDQNDWY